MLQVLSWVMTHPAHDCYVAPFFVCTVFFFFLNDRLKCFCQYSLSQGTTVFLKKYAFLNCILKGYHVSYKWNFVTFVERKGKIAGGLLQLNV